MAPATASLGLLLAEWRAPHGTAAPSCLVLATRALRAAQGVSASGGEKRAAARACSFWLLLGGRPTRRNGRGLKPHAGGAKEKKMCPRRDARHSATAKPTTTDDRRHHHHQKTRFSHEQPHGRHHLVTAFLSVPFLSVRVGEASLYLHCMIKSYIENLH